MVRITRFSFDEGMRIDDPVPRNALDDDYDFIGDDDCPPVLPARRKKRGKRSQPDDRRPDRRQRPGSPWKKPESKAPQPTEGAQGTETEAPGPSEAEDGGTEPQ